MSVEIIAQVTNGAFYPMSEHDEEIMHSLSGEYKLVATQPRNVGNHKRFFAFLKIIFDMQESFEDIDMFRSWLLMKAGYVKTAVAPNGVTFFVPESMSWASMDEPVFQKVFGKIINVVVSDPDLNIGQNAIDNALEFL